VVPNTTLSVLKMHFPWRGESMSWLKR
jgi:hypothetical protein